MGAIDDDLTEARARHPHWGVWISSAGRYWAQCQRLKAERLGAGSVRSSAV